MQDLCKTVITLLFLTFFPVVCDHNDIKWVRAETCCLSFDSLPLNKVLLCFDLPTLYHCDIVISHVFNLCAGVLYKNTDNACTAVIA